MELFEKIKINLQDRKEREIRFLGFPIIQYGRKQENQTKEKYFSLFPKSFEKQVLDKILNQINCSDYDDIYLSTVHNLGDIYFLTSFIKTWQKNNNSKNPILILQNDSSVQVVKMFAADIANEVITLHYGDIISLKKYKHKYKNHRFFICFPRHFYDARNKICLKGEKCDFYDYMSSVLQFNVKEQVKYKLININADFQFDEKIKKIGLNVDKFIFFVPEARCCSHLDVVFWQMLKKNLKVKGYDIFYNIHWTTKILGAKTCNLTLQEAYKLATMSRGIIALRNGFSEILSTCQVPKHIIYTDFLYRELNCYEVQKMFPYLIFTKNSSIPVYEYFYEHIKDSTEDLVENIVRRF